MTFRGLLEGFKMDTKLLKSLRKDFIDDFLNTNNIKVQWTLLTDGLEMRFRDTKDVEKFEDAFYEYLEDNDIEVSWSNKGPKVIRIQTYDVNENTLKRPMKFFYKKVSDGMYYIGTKRATGSKTYGGDFVGTIQQTGFDRPYTYEVRINYNNKEQFKNHIRTLKDAKNWVEDTLEVY